jgi:hypothetical protein
MQVVCAYSGVRGAGGGPHKISGGTGGVGSDLVDFATKVTNRTMGTVEAIPPDANGESK